MALGDENLDWTYIRSFLAVAETGSLSAAARETGQSQPTLGRHIKLVEAALGTVLFTRVPTGLRLTDAGMSLLEPARQMSVASIQFATLAAGYETRLSGTVRITASVVVSHYILPEILAALRIEEPDIEIELVPSDATENLIYREADIAVRMYRPTQLDIVTRKIADQSMALFAAKTLIARLGQPEQFEDLARFPFVGFDRSELIIRTMTNFGFPVDRHFFGTRCDDQSAFWELVCAGCGIGAMQTTIGDRDERVERLALQPPLPSLPMWLAATDAMRQSLRVKRVWEFLAEALKARVG